MNPEGSRQALYRLRDESRDRVSSPITSARVQGYLDLERAYLDLALLRFLEDADIDGFFHDACLAARTRRRLLARMAEGLSCPEERRRSTLLASILAALASGERGVIADLAGTVLTLDEGPGDPRQEVAFADALSWTILGQFTEAEAPFSRFERARDARAEDRSLILGGILKSDEARFNQGIEAFVAAIHPRPGEARLSLPALGFARLGQRFGLTITVIDPAIPGELLGEPEAPYPHEVIP